MSLFDIFKVKKLGTGADSLFAASVGMKLKAYAEFNKWDEEWEEGNIDITTGQNTASSRRIRSKNYIPVSPDTVYCIYGKWMGLYFYDSDKNYISWTGSGAGTTAVAKTFTVPANARFLRFRGDDNYGNTYNNDICINVSKTTGSPKNGDYVPYGG